MAANGKPRSSTNGTTSGRCTLFTKGNPGGPGNPFAKRIAMYRRAIYAETTIEDVRRVFRKIIECAARGDVAAQKLFLDRLLGKDPVSVVQVLMDDRKVVDHVRDEENQEGDYDPRGW